MHGFSGIGCDPREEGRMREEEGVGLEAEVFHDGGLDSILDPTVDLEVGLGEEVRVEGVDVDKLLSLGQGAAVQVQDGGAAGGAALGEAPLRQRDETVDLLVPHEAVEHDAAALGGQAAPVAEALDLPLEAGGAERVLVALLLEDLSLLGHDGVGDGRLGRPVHDEGDARRHHDAGPPRVRQYRVLSGEALVLAESENGPNCEAGT